MYTLLSNPSIEEHIKNFLDFIYADEGMVVPKEIDEEIDALSVENLSAAQLLLKTRGLDLFYPHRVLLENRDRAWEEYWKFWILTIRMVFRTKSEARLIFMSNVKGSMALVNSAFRDLSEERERIDRLLGIEHPGKRKRKPLAPITAKVMQQYFPHLLSEGFTMEGVKEEEDDEYW
jgi:hypothetical protein